MYSGSGSHRNQQHFHQNQPHHQRHEVRQAIHPTHPPCWPSFERNQEGAARLERLKKHRAELQSETQTSASSIQQAREVRVQTKRLESAIASLEATLQEAQQNTKHEMLRACNRLDSLSQDNCDRHQELTATCSRIEASVGPRHHEALAAACTRIEALVEKQAHEISQLRAGVEQKLTLASACSQRETSCNQMLQMRRELSDLRADVDRTATKHNCVLSGNTIVERLFVTSRTQTGSKTLQRIGSADLQ